MKKKGKFLVGYIVAFLMGILLTSVTVYAVDYLYASSDVSYSNVASELEATNVQDALDELYSKFKGTGFVCPEGYVCAQAATCAAGQYLRAGGLSCTSCPAGKYCEGGIYQLGKDVDQGISGDCAVGTYSTGGASSCSNCAAGTYSSSTGATSCSTCSAGTYSQAGASSCSTCNAGTYSGTGAGSCTACGGGKWSSAGSSSCSNITAGCYGTSGSSACPSECAGRTKYSAAGSSSCSTVSSGYYTTGCTGNNRCTGQSRCTAGNYCTNGVSQACASGYTSGAGATSCTAITCTVYCKGSGSCSKTRPTSQNTAFGVFTCNAGTGKTTGSMQSCWVRNDVAEPTTGYLQCDGGGWSLGWSWMCTSGQVVNCDNNGGLVATCNKKSKHCGSLTAGTMKTSGSYSCSC